MTTTTKVFACLNILAVLVFALVTAPVAAYRRDTREAIDKEIAKIPVLQQEIVTLDRNRVKLQHDVNREKGNVKYAINTGLNQKSHLEGTIAILTDALNDSKTKAKNWALSLRDVQAEIVDRKAEITSLTTTKAELEKAQADLSAEVTALQSQLDRARLELDRIQKDNLARYSKLADLENRTVGSSEAARLANVAP